MQIEHKAVPVGGVHVADESLGIVDAIVSVTGVVDEVKDVIEPGAYAKTLATRTPKGVWSHDWDSPISKTLAVKELLPGDPALPKETRDGKPWPREAGALLVKTQFNLNTQRGRDAFEDVKFFGESAEWSIGYQVPVGGATVEQKTGVRRIKTLELYEYSPVLFGAMPMAGTLSVKTAQAAWRAARAAVVEDALHDLDEELKDLSTGSMPASTSGLTPPERVGDNPHPFEPGGPNGTCAVCQRPRADHEKAAPLAANSDDLMPRLQALAEAEADEDDEAKALASAIVELKEAEADDVDDVDAREVLMAMVADGSMTDDELKSLGFDDEEVGRFREAKALYDELETKVFGTGTGLAHTRRVVRTAAGAAAYGQPIGTVIDANDDDFERRQRDQRRRARVARDAASLRATARYGSSDVARRENAIANLRKGPFSPGFANARRILMDEYGFTGEDLLRVREGGKARFTGTETRGPKAQADGPTTTGMRAPVFDEPSQGDPGARRMRRRAKRGPVSDEDVKSLLAEYEAFKADETKVRRVRTPEGAQKFGRPIGSVIPEGTAVRVVVPDDAAGSQVGRIVERDTDEDGEPIGEDQLAVEFENGQGVWAVDEAEVVDVAGTGVDALARRVPQIGQHATTPDGRRGLVVPNDDSHESLGKFTVRFGDGTEQTFDRGELEWDPDEDRLAWSERENQAAALNGPTPSDDEVEAMLRRFLDEAADLIEDDEDEEADDYALVIDVIDEAFAAGNLTNAQYEALLAKVEAEFGGEKTLRPTWLRYAIKAGGADRNRGGAEKLRRYWTHGAGAAKIRWGTPGDWTRCVRQLTKYLGPRAKGYCNLRHKEVNGYYPGDDKNKAAEVAELERKVLDVLADPAGGERLVDALGALHAALAEEGEAEVAETVAELEDALSPAELLEFERLAAELD